MKWLTIDSVKDKLEVQNCWQMKAKIGLVILAQYTTVTSDIKFAEVSVQKLEEKKRIIDIEILDRYSRLLLHVCWYTFVYSVIKP